MRPHKFNDHDLNLLQFLATQTSVTIRNVQLVSRLNKFTEELEKRVEERTEALEHILQELRQERDRVDTLYHIARQLSTSLDLDRVLNEALHLLARAIPITQGSILLITPSSDHLVYRAALGRRRPLPRGGKQTRYKIGVGLAGRVLETRQPKIVHNLLEDDSWIPDDKELLHRSVLAVPLITSYEALGVLMLFHTQPNHFTNDHLSMVTAAAPMVATAISNADLYTLITQQSERVGILLRGVQAEAIKNEAIVEGITDGVLVVDADDSIQLVNPAVAKILGVPREELQGRKLDTILAEMTSPVDQQVAQMLYQIVTTQQANLPEQDETFVERISIEDKTIIASLTSISLTSNPKTPASILIVLRDISQEAELDRIKNEFISTVSHELRTPMTSIKGYIDLLVTNKVGSLTDMQRKFLQIIKSNVDRLSALVNDILDISRLDAGRVKLEQQSINLDTVIQSVMASFDHQLEEKNLSLRLDIPDDLPLAYADPDRVMQVLVNLVGNATKYSQPNDSITITVEVVDQYFQIKVCDTGLGISEEDQKRVFDRFFRAERDANSLVDGTGLGLPIAKMFVEMMGGT
ncbi:MAG: GAF domain-containing protein, partial [Aliifodinibius sp.]|nr:GAF domain-containing protein [Fodinibius sp.]NIY24403.1 GAF domain-containing protein [Fodinibius sp.]